MRNITRTLLYPYVVADVTDNGISSAYFLTQEFIDNAIQAFLSLQKWYRARGQQPPAPHILLRHCFRQGDPNHAHACMMVHDNACGMTEQQILEKLLTLGVGDSSQVQAQAEPGAMCMSSGCALMPGMHSQPACIYCIPHAMGTSSRAASSSAPVQLEAGSIFMFLAASAGMPGHLSLCHTASPQLPT